MTTVAILEIISAFQAVDWESKRVLVNLSQFQGDAAWGKMDATARHLEEYGWVVIDHRMDTIRDEEML